MITNVEKEQFTQALALAILKTFGKQQSFQEQAEKIVKIMTPTFVEAEPEPSLLPFI